MSDETNDVGIYSDLELERQLLRYLILVDASFVPHVDQDVFYGSDERIIFDVLKANLQTTFPSKMLKSVLTKQLGSETFDEVEPTIDDIIKSPKIETFKAAQIILKDLQDLYMQRSIIESSQAAINFAKDELIEDAMSALHTVVRAKAKQSVDSGNYVEDFDERQAIIKSNAEKAEEEAVLIPTGISKFDQIAGGIKKGEVGIVVGKTGGGKSVSKLNFAVHAYLSGFNVAFFGLEMSKHENEFRADSLITNIPATMFRKSLLTDRDYDAWGKKIKQLKKERKNYLEFVGAKAKTLSEILALAEGIENKYKKAIDLMIIDHLVLIKGENRRQDFHMQQWDTMERLSDWASQMNKAVWSSGQSTDEGVTRKKGMRVIDVKYSRAIAELANILVALYQSDIDAASGDLKFAVRKGRGMKSGDEINLKPDFARMILDQHSFALHRTEKSDKKKKGGQGKL